ncbi:MAG: PilZ domain-containing protein [Planctomycetota bacterium]
MLNAPVEERGECDRRHGRVRIEETNVSLGKVLDLSRSGMRVRTSRPIKETDPPMLVGIDADGERFQVQCKVAWVEKRGMFKRFVGLEFQGLDQDTEQRLAFLARSAASNSPMQSSMLGRAS